MNYLSHLQLQKLWEPQVAFQISQLPVFHLVLSLILSTGIVATLQGQDSQADQLYKIWVSSRSDPTQYIVSGRLQSVADSSIIVMVKNDAQMKIQVGQIGQLRIVPEKSGKSGKIILGVGVGMVAAHYLIKTTGECYPSFPAGDERCTSRSLSLRLGGGLIGGVIAAQFITPNIKIPINGSNNIYQQQKEQLKQYIAQN